MKRKRRRHCDHSGRVEEAKLPQRHTSAYTLILTSVVLNQVCGHLRSHKRLPVVHFIKNGSDSIPCITGQASLSIVKTAIVCLPVQQKRSL